MSFILSNEIVMSFRDFIQDQQIAGTALGFLIASSTLDVARVFVREGVMPFVYAIRSTSIPKFDIDSIIQTLITFFVTMLVVFATVRIFDLQTKKIPVVATVSNAAL
jgi:large-conductance mechanosensitive channel